MRLLPFSSSLLSATGALFFVNEDKQVAGLALERAADRVEDAEFDAVGVFCVFNPSKRLVLNA